MQFLIVIQFVNIPPNQRFVTKKELHFKAIFCVKIEKKRFVQTKRAIKIKNFSNKYS